ncbi:MAG: hypothetical protein ACJ76V_11830 [Thermoleophilaceae bacterium]
MNARQERHSHEGPLRYAVAWIVWFAVLFALWMALIDHLAIDDILNGVVCAAIGASAAELVDAQRIVRVRFRPRWFAVVPRQLWRFLLETFLVIGVLFRVLVLRRRVRGHFRAVRFRAGGEDAFDAGRRTLFEWAGSFSANRYVIGVDGEHDSALMHELVESDEPLDSLGLG